MLYLACFYVHMYNGPSTCCACADYAMENKWKFVERVRSLNSEAAAASGTAEHSAIPIPETLKEVAHLKKIVVKNKNEEGGLGIHIFR